MPVRDRHRLKQPLASRAGSSRPVRGRARPTTTPAATRIQVPRSTRLALGLLALVLTLEITTELTGFPGPAHPLRVWLGTAVIAGSALLCAARARLVPVHRGAWAAIAAGMLSWSAGTVLWEALYSGASHQPAISGADALWLMWYPFTATALALLARARLARFELHRWMDGLVVVLLVLAAAFPLALHPLDQYFSSNVLAGLVDLSYPVLDTLLLGGILGTFALMGWRPDRTWILIATGCVAMTIADTWFATQHARGIAGNLQYDFLWSGGALMIACAAWAPAVHRHEHRELDGWLAITLPLFAQLLAIALQLGIVLFPDFDTETHRATVLLVLLIGAIQLVLARPRRQRRDDTRSGPLLRANN